MLRPPQRNGGGPRAAARTFRDASVPASRRERSRPGVPTATWHPPGAARVFSSSPKDCSGGVRPSVGDRAAQCMVLCCRCGAHLPTDEASDAHVRVTRRDAPDDVGDLAGNLTGRRDHHHLRLRDAGVHPEERDGAEAHRFPSARLGLHDQVAADEPEGDRCSLDRRRLHEPRGSCEGQNGDPARRDEQQQRAGFGCDCAGSAILPGEHAPSPSSICWGSSRSLKLPASLRTSSVRSKVSLTPTCAIHAVEAPPDGTGGTGGRACRAYRAPTQRMSLSNSNRPPWGRPFPPGWTSRLEKIETRGPLPHTAQKSSRSTSSLCAGAVDGSRYERNWRASPFCQSGARGSNAGVLDGPKYCLFSTHSCRNRNEHPVVDVGLSRPSLPFGARTSGAQVHLCLCYS